MMWFLESYFGQYCIIIDSHYAIISFSVVVDLHVIYFACFQINRPYNLQCFLNENTVFTDIVKFEYQPQDNDSVSCYFT